MIKKSIIQRKYLKEKLIKKYYTKRNDILLEIKKTKNLNDIFLMYKKLEKLPKNSCKIRLRNHCWKTAKSKSYYNFFGLCRNLIKNYSENCFLPGIIKSSW
jgi:small subunit ribosomal protein S14